MSLAIKGQTKIKLKNLKEYQEYHLGAKFRQTKELAFRLHQKELKQK